MFLENMKRGLFSVKNLLVAIVIIALLAQSFYINGLFGFIFSSQDISRLYEVYYIHSVATVFEIAVIFSGILAFLFPLLATISSGTAYLDDVNSGFINNVLIRQGKKKYLRSKYFSSLLISFISILVPLLVVLFFLTLLFPTTDLSPLFPTVIVFEGYAFNQLLFFQNPIGYTIIRVLLISLMGASISSLAFVASSFTKNKFIVYAFPFLCITTLSVITSAMGIRFSSLEDFIKNSVGGNFTIFLGFIITIPLISFLVFYLKKGKEDVI